MSGLTKLTELSLDSTNRNGAIPDLSALVNLQILDLSSNALTGSLSNLRTLTNLRALYLHHNPALSGSLPSGLRTVRGVHLHGTGVTGGPPGPSPSPPWPTPWTPPLPPMIRAPTRVGRLWTVTKTNSLPRPPCAKP